MEEQKVKDSKQDVSIVKIVVLVNLACICYTSLQTLTKDMLTYRDVRIYEFAFFRSLFNLGASALIIKYERKNFFADISRDLTPTLLVRCAVGTVSFLLFSLSVKYLPLGIFFIIFNSSPFFTVILSYFWTGDRILCFEGLAMIGAFAGIVCLGMAKPSEDSQSKVQDLDSMSDFEKQYAYQIGLIMAVISCVAQSVISVASRRLKSLHFAVIQFAYALMASCVMGIALAVICVKNNHVPYSYDSWYIYLEVLLSAFLNMCGQNLTTYAN